MDEAAQRLFPELHQKNLRAAARIVPGTTRPRTARPISGDNVPGHTEPDRARLPARNDTRPPWARHPKYIGGHPEPFFTIGALAEALGRSPNTIRAWISAGSMPEAHYRKKTPDVRGRRRYYTQAQIEGLVRLADEESLLGTKRRNPASTHFPQRARALFDQFAAKATARRTA